MTVDQLISALKRMDPDTEVRFCYDYGNRTHTEVASGIEEVEEGEVYYSEYVQDYAALGEDDKALDYEVVKPAILLKSCPW